MMPNPTLQPLPESASTFVPIFTPWQIPDPADPQENAAALDEARDLLFRQQVCKVLNEQAPWLLPILVAAGAQIAAYPGRFIVMLGDRHPEPIEVPALGAHLVLLPWVEPDEVSH